jgi:anti-sigma B factor antagonist
MTVRTVERGRERRLILSGELDIAMRPLLDRAIAAVEYGSIDRLVLDLSSVTFMDSTGLHAVLVARELCARHACEIVIVPGSEQVQRLFALSGLSSRLESGPDEAA